MVKEANFFTLKTNDEFTTFLVYVDDITVSGTSMVEINIIKSIFLC